jgi:predicted N-formylglutamate amidohydrolase
LRRESGLVVEENKPYRVTDETDFGVPVHAERGGLDYLTVEIRQDLIRGKNGQAEWSARLARLLPQAEGLMAEGAKAEGVAKGA